MSLSPIEQKLTLKVGGYRSYSKNIFSTKNLSPQTTNHYKGLTLPSSLTVGPHEPNTTAHERGVARDLR
jgi:hypothetical protein